MAALSTNRENCSVHLGRFDPTSRKWVALCGTWRGLTPHGEQSGERSCAKCVRLSRAERAAEFAEVSS